MQTREDRLVRQRAWYLANKDRILALQREYNKKNAKRISERKKEKYWTEIEKHRAKRKAYYAANRSKAIANAARWAKENKERHLEYRRKRYHSDKVVRPYIYKKYAKNRTKSGKAKIYNRSWRIKNKGLYRMMKRRATNKLTNKLSDGYVRTLLKQKFSIKNPTPQQIEHRRSIIFIRRQQKWAAAMNAASHLTNESCATNVS